MRRFLAACVASGTLLSGAPFPVSAEPVSVQSRVIENFKVGSAERTFGDLTFTGGLLLSGGSRFGAMSGIRLGGDRQSFIGVMDTGHWYAGRFLRDEGGRLAGVESVTVSPIIGRDGMELEDKTLFDAEGIAIRGDEILVSFEREHRVDVYPAKNPAASPPLSGLPIPIPIYEFRRNRGLEALAVFPPSSPRAGAAVAISEKSLNKKGDIFAAILDGANPGIFYVRRLPPFDVTDADFLPGGDLIILERRYRLAEGVGMRLRRISGASIAPGRTVDGDILFEADLGYQIDNMEGFDISEDSEGTIYFTMVSDDNQSILQRNIVLEFRYDGPK